MTKEGNSFFFPSHPSLHFFRGAQRTGQQRRDASRPGRRGFRLPHACRCRRCGPCQSRLGNSAPIARGTLCPGHVLVPWAHSPIWFRQDAIFVRLSKALPIKGRRAPSSSKAEAATHRPDPEPTTPRPHEVGSVRRSARQAAAARWSRAGGAADPSRPASARRSRLDLSPAPVCARTEAVWFFWWRFLQAPSPAPAERL